MLFSNIKFISEEVINIAIAILLSSWLMEIIQITIHKVSKGYKSIENTNVLYDCNSSPFSNFVPKNYLNYTVEMGCLI